MIEKNSYMYITIPREKILNKKKRKHRNNNFKRIYYYVDNQEFCINDQNIKEVDIYDMKEIQSNTLYKHSYKSTKDNHFDWYFRLKPEYEDCKDIYIKKDKQKDRLRLSYKKNIAICKDKMKNNKKCNNNKKKCNKYKNNKKVFSKEDLYIDFSI